MQAVIQNPNTSERPQVDQSAKSFDPKKDINTLMDEIQASYTEEDKRKEQELQAKKPEANAQKQENNKKKEHPNSFIYQLAQSEFMQNLPAFANYLSIAGNAISSFTHAAASVTTVNEDLKKVATKFGELGTQASLLLNGLTCSLEFLSWNNIVSAIGYFIDVPISLFSKQSSMFPRHGWATGIYCAMNAFLTSNKRDKKFTNFKENLDFAKQGVKKSLSHFKSNLFDNLINSKTGLLSVVGSMLMFSGASIWQLTPFQLMGSTIRDIGGLCQDLEQIKPEFFKTQKKYWWSGVGVTLGTLFDYAGRICDKWFPQYKMIFYPLSFLFDGVGRYLLQLHQKEDQNKSKAEKEKNSNPGNIRSIYDLQRTNQVNKPKETVEQQRMAA